MKHLILTSTFAALALTGCEYTGPSKPSKPHGLSKYKYERNKKKVEEAGSHSLLKNFLEEDEKANTASAPKELNEIELPGFKGDYLKKLKAKYPMLDVAKIEDKDLNGNVGDLLPRAQ